VYLAEVGANETRESSFVNDTQQPIVKARVRSIARTYKPGFHEALFKAVGDPVLSFDHYGTPTLFKRETKSLIGGRGTGVRSGIRHVPRELPLGRLD